MYYDYFGFNQPPFRITPDTSLFYPGGDRGAILDALLYAILNGEGIIKVVGEVGSGKTMLCRMLEKELPDKVEVVYLVNPSIAPENTLHAIAFELKLDVDTETSRFEVMNALQQYLLRRHSENRQVVVFVEEAQSMPIATLEEIRLLSNLETQQSKLLQIVLFGQPELDVMIAQPEIRQLKERITYSFKLAPFKTNDIREYINTRVRACGYRSSELFSDAAIKEIEQHSHGLLRRINILADKSLLAVFADNAHKVELRHTRMAARDSEFLSRPAWRLKTLLAGAGLAALAAAAVLILQPQSPAEPETLVQLPDVPPAQEGLAGPANMQLNSPYTSVTDVPVQQAITPPTEDGSVQPVSPPEPQAGPVNPIAPAGTLVPEPAALADGITPSIEPVADANAPALEYSGFSPLIDENSRNLGGGSQLSSVEQAVVPDPAVADSELLGMSAVYQFQDFGDNTLTESEAEQLQNQLTRLPPESIESQDPVAQSSLCRHCWSIIYRPLPIRKNL